MNQKFILEISVETAERALAAQRGGADRIELCGKLSSGGITPSVKLLRTVRGQVHLPIFAMIRPRGGDFVYTDAEFTEMKRAILAAKESEMNGVVLGILKENHSVDRGRTKELVELARPLPVTYHRAFDDSADLRQALEDVIYAGATRLLTSGGTAGAPQGAPMLAELVAEARDRIIIVPGAGINASNILEIAQKTRAREFHSGLSSALPYSSHDYETFEAEVRKLARALTDLE